MPGYEYKEQNLVITDSDSEYKEYFDAAREHRLVVRRCTDCNLMRGEPGHACPWCMSLNWEWVTVSGKGTIYSYQIIAHSVLPGFRDWAPYAIVLVELDEQSGQPAEHDGLRLTTNLLNDNFEPEDEEKVMIGARVEVVFQDIESGITLPQFKLSGEAPKGEVWRYPA